MAFLLGGMIAPAWAGDADFQTWLRAFKDEAAQSGIRRATIDSAFTGVAPIPKVLELDRHQPESTITFDDYIARVVSPGRVDNGRKALDDNRALLTDIGSRYGVQPRFIVALWGIETDFGKVSGTYPVIGSLATLAYDGRRSSLFRGELLAALKIIDQGHIKPSEMLGSWAGAMGQTQFMPSTFLSYAVDYRGHNKQDIWNDRGDALASIANYLSHLGWNPEIGWGTQVVLPPGFDTKLVSLDIDKPIEEWRALGVTTPDGAPVPGRDLRASIVRPGDATGPSLLVYSNYRAIMKWNRSLYFATAVSYLAERIGN
ncbi:MAG TPA: lytic murein transglycosylase [Stellaceae bacterium]|nr:lytic murein transglycosylase [Stellaceae bacterium]